MGRRRIFDELGMDSFQALLAPLLVDSHDLQAAVFEAGIPDEMLAGVDSLGVVGLAVLPGPMRKILGVDHPFIAPDDFAGQVVGIQQSQVADLTMAALGAPAEWSRVAPSSSVSTATSSSSALSQATTTSSRRTTSRRTSTSGHCPRRPHQRERARIIDRPQRRALRDAGIVAQPDASPRVTPTNGSARSSAART